MQRPNVILSPLEIPPSQIPNKRSSQLKFFKLIKLIETPFKLFQLQTSLILKFVELK